MSLKERVHENRKIIAAAALVAVIALAAVSINSALGGSLDPDDSDVFVVVTGSMDAGETDWPISTIPVNSLVIVKTLDRDELSEVSVGDVLAYEWKGLTVVHRVVAIDEESEIFTTKGDANNYTDPIPYDDAIGTVINVYPHLGQLVMFMKGNIALTIAGIIALVIAVSSVIEIYRIVTNKEEK